MTCPTCGRSLPEAFPGASLPCPCGALVEVPRASAHPPSSRRGPYRDAGDMSWVPPERETTCPYCSNTIRGLVRICPHCDVRLDNVRCVRCFSLQPPGAFSCGRCGQAMELEPLLDA